MKADEPELQQTVGGVTVRYRGRSLYAPSDPVGSALRRVRQFLSDTNTDRTLVLVPSLGLGYGLSELLDGLPETSQVICVEADQSLFATALASADLPRSPRLRVVRTQQTEAALSVLHEMGVWRFRRVRKVPLCGGYGLHRPVYDGMLAAIEQEIRTHWQNRMTLISMGRLWIRNLIMNLGTLPSTGSLQDLKTSGPIVVAGAGPSLDTGVAWMKENRDRIRILAVDTAVSVLAGCGIEPDWIFVLEAQVVNLQDFLGLSLQAPIIADLTSTPALLRHAGQDGGRSAIHLYSSDFGDFTVLDRLTEAGLRPVSVPPLGSVGVAALHAALLMTDDQVCVTGLDFGYTGGKTHARGAPSHLALVARSDRVHPVHSQVSGAIWSRNLQRVDGKSGPTMTDGVLLSYAEQAGRIAAREARVFDLDSDGVGIGASAPTDLAFDRSRLQAPLERQKRQDWTQSAVRAFAEDEVALLNQLEDRLEHLLKNDGDPGEAERSLLRKADYLLVDFADSERLATPDRSFLARVRREIPYYRVIWRRLL